MNNTTNTKMEEVKTALEKYLQDVRTNEAKIAAMIQIGWGIGKVKWRFALRHPIVAFHMWRIFAASRKDSAAA